MGHRSHWYEYYFKRILNSDEVEGWTGGPPQKRDANALGTREVIDITDMNII